MSISATLTAKPTSLDLGRAAFVQVVKFGESRLLETRARYSMGSSSDPMSCPPFHESSGYGDD